MDFEIISIHFFNFCHLHNFSKHFAHSLEFFFHFYENCAYLAGFFKDALHNFFEILTIQLFFDMT